jgi:hypothetical protein
MKFSIKLIAVLSHDNYYSQFYRPPPSSAEVKNCGATPPPHTSSWRGA